jgi:hypothetical protein
MLSPLSYGRTTADDLRGAGILKSKQLSAQADCSGQAALRRAMHRYARLSLLKPAPRCSLRSVQFLLVLNSMLHWLQQQSYG